MSKVWAELKRGGSVTDIAKRAGVDPVLAEIAADHANRTTGCQTCPAITPGAKFLSSCASCPLASIARTRRTS